MQSISTQPVTAMAAQAGTSPSTTEHTVDPDALCVALAGVADPRRRQGTRFPLPALLTLTVAAMLSNHLSVLAVAEWGASQCQDLLRALGLNKGVAPHQSTLQRLFRRLDPDQLSTALSSYFCACSSTDQRPRGSEGVAIDGKAQRGRLAFDASGCPVHVLSAFLPEQGIVLAQEPIDSGGPDDKAEAELTVAPALIARIDWPGRVMTADALLCQRNLCQEVVEAGGDYLLEVKENQPTLHEDIRWLFEPPADCALPLADRREAESVDNGHGRRYDTRQLSASTDLVGYSDWPALAQVFRLERTWQEAGATKREVHYGITSLPPEVADAARLLVLKRGHWQIENSLHWVKDATLGEDRSLVHLGSGPSVMGMLRDLTVSLLRRVGCRTIAKRLRFHSCHPEQAVALLTGGCCQNA